MQFNVNVQSLLDALNIATRALSSARGNAPILEGVYLSADQDRLYMTCADGSLSIETSVPAEIKEEGTAVLPGKLFNELIRKLPGGEVSVKVNENYSAAIRCMSFKSNIVGMNPAEYSEIERVKNGTTIQIPQKKLKEMITHVVFAIATDETRQILTGSLVEVTPDELRMVALDGFRLSLQRTSMPFNIPEGKENVHMLVPGRVMNEMSKILNDSDEFCTISFDNKKMEATFGDITLTASLMAGEFIDYKKILPPTFRTKVTVDRMMLLDAIDRASLLAREGKNNLIRMSFRTDIMTISSNASLGDVLEELPAELDGDPIDMAFNAKYISDIIRNIDEEKICLNLNSNVSPCVIAQQDGEEYLYLILPIRVMS